MSLWVGVAKHHMAASAHFFRENLLRMRQRLMTFLGSLECTVHVMITPLYHYSCLRYYTLPDGNKWCPGKEF